MNNKCIYCNRQLIRFRGEHKQMYQGRFLHKTCSNKLKITNPSLHEMVISTTKHVQDQYIEAYLHRLND